MGIFTATPTGSTLTGTKGKDALYGDSGNDLLQGLGGADTLSGDDGNDTLVGGAGLDVLHGGAGNDVFKYNDFSEMGSTTTLSFTYTYERILDFWAGDRIDVSAITTRSFIGEAEFTGTAGEMRISWGTFTSDRTTELSVDTDGDGEADIFIALDGRLHLTESVPGSGILVLAENQTRSGDAGNNTLQGDAGNDLLSGAGGNDLLIGGDGNDTLDGGSGDDTLVGGYSADQLTGGAGKDTFRFAALEEARSPWFSATPNDVITDFASGDRIDLSGLGLRFIGDGRFSHRPGELRAADASLQVDADGDGLADFTIVVDGLQGVAETAKGSGILTGVAGVSAPGTARADAITGGSGWDTLNGGDGDDTVRGAAGSDSLNGGAGNDVIDGGTGRDIMTGGAGLDVFRYNAMTEFGAAINNIGDRITDFGIGDKLSLAAISGLKFIGDATFHHVAGEVRSYYDAFGYPTSATKVEIDSDGDGFADAILQLDGKVLLQETAAGSLVLRSIDSRTVTGTLAAETLNGSVFNDSINGGAGNDSISGYDGNDTLIGGAGADTLAGGGGADRFVFRNGDVGSGSARDAITDFTIGTDKIDLSQIDAITTVAGDQGFTLLASNAAFTKLAGQLRVSAGILEGDTNGDGAADFQIQLPYWASGVSASDLVL